MPRRTPYSKVNKMNRVRAAHAVGMGDVVFKGVQCLNSDCEEFFFIREADIVGDYEIICPKCGYKLESGGETYLFDYTMDVKRDGEIVVMHALDRRRFAAPPFTRIGEMP